MSALFSTIRAIFRPVPCIWPESEGLTAFSAFACDGLHRLILRPALLTAVRPVLDIFRKSEGLPAELACSCYHSYLRFLWMPVCPDKHFLYPLEHWSAPFSHSFTHVSLFIFLPNDIYSYLLCCCYRLYLISSCWNFISRSSSTGFWTFGIRQFFSKYFNNQGKMNVT